MVTKNLSPCSAPREPGASSRARWGLWRRRLLPGPLGGVQPRSRPRPRAAAPLPPARPGAAGRPRRGAVSPGRRPPTPGGERGSAPRGTAERGLPLPPAPGTAGGKGEGGRESSEAGSGEAAGSAPRAGPSAAGAQTRRRVGRAEPGGGCERLRGSALPPSAGAGGTAVCPSPGRWRPSWRPGRAGGTPSRSPWWGRRARPGPPAPLPLPPAAPAAPSPAAPEAAAACSACHPSLLPAGTTQPRRRHVRGGPGAAGRREMGSGPRAAPAGSYGRCGAAAGPPPASGSAGPGDCWPLGP